MSEDFTENLFSISSEQSEDFIHAVDFIKNKIFNSK